MTLHKRLTVFSTLGAFSILACSLTTWQPTSQPSGVKSPLTTVNRYVSAPLPTQTPATPSAPTTTSGPSSDAPAVDTPLATKTVFLPTMVKFIAQDGWSTLAANPERTSWVSDEVRGTLSPLWYKPIEPLIPEKSQIIATNNILYIATARGLYALDAATGSQLWVFPTELPLGNSPTVYNGIAYVGGLDHNLYALNAVTGALLWTFQAGGGFDTNPLIVGDKVMLGNRDGSFYAVYTQGTLTGTLAWKYSTQGPIHYTAALKDDVVFFASDDSYAYALNANAGTLVWKSTKLPGYGFRSWWPVIYQNYVIFSGSSAVRSIAPLGDERGQFEDEFDCVFPGGPPSALTWLGTRGSNGWIDASKAINCTETYPWRRTYFVLNRATGVELTMDTNQNGKAEYAPILWFGTHSGNRYPPVIGKDGILYQAMPYLYEPSSGSFRGGVAGWQFNTKNISNPTAKTLANDEPIAYSAGGNVIYYIHCCDRSAGAVDISIPNPGSIDSSREWVYYDEGTSLADMIPGYNQMYFSTDLDAVFGDSNGVYGLHGDQSAPIPYKGMVYQIRSNAVIAFSAAHTTPTALPLAAAQTVQTTVTVDVNTLKQALSDQVEKILAAGHLRPGYGISGNFDLSGKQICGDNMMDYWHDPTDSLITLMGTLPYLTTDQQNRVKAYLRSEFQNFPPYDYVHIGWKDGASRDWADLPPEMDLRRLTIPPSEWLNYDFKVWQFPPHIFYAMWKYAQVFGGAKTIFDASMTRLEPTPGNDVLVQMPFVHNSFIAGLWGYLELQKLAGYTETASIRTDLNRLLALRAATFSKDSPYGSQVCSAGTPCYCKTISVSRNFMNLTPELGDYLQANALAKVQAAVDEYNRVAPYWFVSEYEATYGEGVIQPIYDSFSVFQARALVLKQPYNQLVKYLDVPMTARGDFYYIQNLVAAILASTR
jgi:hypothetical protein